MNNDVLAKIKEKYLDKNGRLMTRWIYKDLTLMDKLKYLSQVKSNDCGELLFCIENNLSSQTLCPMCSNIVNFKSYSEGYTTCCSKRCSNLYRLQIEPTHLNKFISAGASSLVGKKPWNVGLKYDVPKHQKYKDPEGWEHNKNYLREKLGGENNPSFGKSPSIETRNKQSASTRKIIREGKFTPNSNNSNTHWDSFCRQKKFRSSWEAAFYSMHQEGDLEYESLRIDYHFEERDRVYIVDFISHKHKVVYEVKPMSYLEEPITLSKLSALKEWCEKNEYIMVIVDELYLKERISLINMRELDDNTIRKLGQSI